MAYEHLPTDIGSDHNEFGFQAENLFVPMHRQMRGCSREIELCDLRYMAVQEFEEIPDVIERLEKFRKSGR